jgi:hypothetical protein
MTWNRNHIQIKYRNRNRLKNFRFRNPGLIPIVMVVRRGVGFSPHLNGGWDAGGL